ncbi:MAG: glutaredoxin 3 [Deltaproteobacteria bacterium]|nr:glutaredoxin 3 [Deltaproteobacteria bacterium]
MARDLTTTILEDVSAQALAKVSVYTTRYCGYCVAAKRLLDKKGAQYVEVSADDRADLRNWLIDATGRHTVPQIFINGRSVGGYDDIATLEKQGKLEPMLAEPPPEGLEALPS